MTPPSSPLSPLSPVSPVSPVSPSSPAPDRAVVLAAAAVATLAIAAIAGIATIGHLATPDGVGPVWVAIGWIAAGVWVGAVVATVPAVPAVPAVPSRTRSLVEAVAAPVAVLASGALLSVSFLHLVQPRALAWIWLWPVAWAGDRLVRRRERRLVDLAVPLAVAAAAGSSTRSAGLAVCLATTVGLLMVTGSIVRAARGFVRRHERTQHELRRRADEAERRRRANWIHDDVLSELQLARLRLETAGGDQQRVLAELGDVEHRLRIRQLDAELESGGARLIDVVQPYIRMVTRAGVAVGAVPTHEIAMRPVDAATGYELQRFLGVAIPNALLAGASVVAVDAEFDGSRLVVRVRDDAGGFDVADVQPGRGRERLAVELGAERLDTRVADGWTAFSCEFTVDVPAAGTSTDE